MAVSDNTLDVRVNAFYICKTRWLVVCIAIIWIEGTPWYRRNVHWLARW